LSYQGHSESPECGYMRSRKPHSSILAAIQTSAPPDVLQKRGFNLSSLPRSNQTGLGAITIMTDSEEPSQFHQFSLLPLEIRDIVWRATAIPRAVLLRRHIASKEPFSSRIWSNKAIGDVTFLQSTALADGLGNDLSLPRLVFGSRCILPIASVCHESRQIAKEIYTKAFGSPLSYPTT
jgi:hypothetical protein